MTWTPTLDSASTTQCPEYQTIVASEDKLSWTPEHRSFCIISLEKFQDILNAIKRRCCRDQDSNLGYCGHNAGFSPLDDRGYHINCQEKYQHDNGQSNYSTKITVTWTPTLDTASTTQCPEYQTIVESEDKLSWTPEDRSLRIINLEKFQDTLNAIKRRCCRDQDSNLGYCGHNAGSSPLDDRGYHINCQEKYHYHNGQSNHSRKIAVTWTPTKDTGSTTQCPEYQTIVASEDKLSWTPEDRSLRIINLEKFQDTLNAIKRRCCRDQDSNLGYCGHNAGSSALDDRGYHLNCQEKYQHDNGQSNYSTKITVTWTPTLDTASTTQCPEHQTIVESEDKLSWTPEDRSFRIINLEKFQDHWMQQREDVVVTRIRTWVTAATTQGPHH